MTRQNRKLAAAPALVALVMLALGALSAGCQYPVGDTGFLYQSNVEMRETLRTMSEAQAQSSREMTQQLADMEQALRNNDQLLSEDVQDLRNRLLEQERVLERMSQYLESIQRDMLRLTGRSPATTSFVPLDDGELPPLDVEPIEGDDGEAPAGTSAAAQAYTTALNQFNLGQYREAREGFRLALELSPSADQEIEILYYLAESCFRMEDYEAAIDYYTQLIRTNAGHPKAWLSFEQLAAINIEMGRHEQALRILRNIVDHYPAYTHIDRVRQRIQSVEELLDAETVVAPSPPATPEMP